MAAEHYESRLRAGSSGYVRASWTRSCSRARVQVHAPSDPRSRCRPGCAARRLPLVLRLLRGPWRGAVPGGEPGVAVFAATVMRDEPLVARRLDAAQRGSGRGRPTSASAVAIVQDQRGAGDRQPPHRAHAAPARGLGHRCAPSRARPRGGTSSTWATPIRAQLLPTPVGAIELAGCCSYRRRGRRRAARRRCSPTA